MALSRLNTPEGAADVAQEVMLSVLVLLRSGRLRNGDSLASFIYGTGRNLINNHIRSQAQSKEEPIPEALAYENGSDPGLAARAGAVGRALQSHRP